MISMSLLKKITFVILLCSCDVIKGWYENDEVANNDDGCLKQQINIFSQLLLSQYKLDHWADMEGLVITSEIDSVCKEFLCEVKFSIAPTRCINNQENSCDVIVISEEEKQCEAFIDIEEIKIEAPLKCTGDEDSYEDDYSLEGAMELDRSEGGKLARVLLASITSQKGVTSQKNGEVVRKRWGQLHGHIHPF